MQSLQSGLASSAVHASVLHVLLHIWLCINLPGYPSVLQVCLLAVQPVCSLVCLSGNASGDASGNLVAWLHICLPGCLSGGLEVCSVARRFIWLHLAAGRVAYQSVWHSVCPSTYSAGCSSCCSFWCPFCSSVNLVICRSVLLPAGCNFVHLPVPQARCQSVFSSANLAGRAPIWRIFCSISCN